MKNQFYLFIVLLFVGTTVNAQEEIIIEPGVGFINEIILADTLADGSRVGDRVYVLKRDADYLVRGAFENIGWKLHIKAEEGTGALPYVRPYPSTDGTINTTFINLKGHGEFENIYFDGQPESDGAGIATRIWRCSYEGLELTVEGCVIDNCGQSAFFVGSAANYIRVNNCQFYNMGILWKYDIGNGRIFDCRGSEINEFSLTNSTFANSVDRIIRHRGGDGVM